MILQMGTISFSRWKRMDSVVEYLIFSSLLMHYVWEASSYLTCNCYLLLLIIRESNNFGPIDPKFEADREKKCRMFWEVLWLYIPKIKKPQSHEATSCQLTPH